MSDGASKQSQSATVYWVIAAAFAIACVSWILISGFSLLALALAVIALAYCFFAYNRSRGSSSRP